MSQEHPNLADEMSDAELVHSVCRRERLTFYNLLKESGSDEGVIKAQLNREYGLYFPKTGYPPGKPRPMDVFGTRWWHVGTFGRKWKVEFDKEPTAKQAYFNEWQRE